MKQFDTTPHVQTLREKLIADATRFCRANNLELSTLGSRVAKHGAFFDRLINDGGDCTTGMYERFYAYFAEHGGVPGDHDVSPASAGPVEAAS